MDYKDVKILIVGGAGFIAAELRELFLRDAYSVISKNRKELDLLEVSNLKNFFEENKFDLIINCASVGGRRNVTDDEGVFFKNFQMFINLLACKDKDTFLINIGSGAEFDRRTPIKNENESNVVYKNPSDFYGKAKNQVAKIINMIGREHKIYNFRVFNCFGTLEKGDRFISSAIKNYINNEIINIHKNLEMDFFYIKDFYFILKRFIEDNILEKKEWLFNDINLCYENKYTLQEISENIINNLSTHKCKIYVDSNKKEYYTGSCDRLKILGFEFAGLEYAIQDFFLEVYSDHQRRNFR